MVHEQEVDGLVDII